MPRYRNALPQLDGTIFLTDGGMETDLIFNHGIELPAFASFVLLKDEAGRKALRRYIEPYLAHAREQGVGFVLETPTWRANRDWGGEVGYDPAALADANREAVALMAAIRDDYADAARAIVLSGNIGPRGDGYSPDAKMTADEAAAYHAEQIGTFAATEADFVSILTVNYVEEAIGVARAAKAADMPCVISFTVETDGNLPTGQPLGEAIAEVDAATGGYPAYYMINCAHPTHFEHVLDADAGWIKRLRGIRANASTCSHAELDEAEELDDGDPVALGASYGALHARFPQITIVGGCCGTDFRHVAEISKAVREAA